MNAETVRHAQPVEHRRRLVPPPAMPPVDLSLLPVSNVTTAMGATMSDRVLYSIVGGLVLMTLVLMVLVRWM